MPTDSRTREQALEVIKNAPNRSYVWISFYEVLGSGEPTPFTLHFPWWVSGSTEEGADIIVAAIPAQTEKEAKAIVVAAFDYPAVTLRYRFAICRCGTDLDFSEGRFLMDPSRMVWFDPEPPKLCRDFSQIEEGSFLGFDDSPLESALTPNTSFEVSEKYKWAVDVINAKGREVVVTANNFYDWGGYIHPSPESAG